MFIYDLFIVVVLSLLTTQIKIIQHLFNAGKYVDGYKVVLVVEYDDDDENKDKVSLYKNIYQWKTEKKGKEWKHEEITTKTLSIIYFPSNRQTTKMTDDIQSENYLFIKVVWFKSRENRKNTWNEVQNKQSNGWMKIRSINREEYKGGKNMKLQYHRNISNKCARVIGFVCDRCSS